MRIVIDIPDELAPCAVKYLERQDFPDDDGRSEANLMREFDLSVDQFVRLMHICDGIKDQIENEIKKTQRTTTMSAKLTALLAEADRTRQIADNAAKRAVESQGAAEELERQERSEKQNIEIRKEAQSAVDNSTLPKWVIRFIEAEAYDRSHSGGQSEVDCYIISCIHTAEEYMRKIS